MGDNKFGGGDCGKNEAKILSAFFAFKKSTATSYLTSGAKKGDQSAEKNIDNAKNFK